MKISIKKEEFEEEQIRVFGREIVQKIENRKILIVGAGALGCEFLKLFSFMGLSTGKDGKIYLCDADEISHSNLHRQFLFSSDDVGQSKAITAAKKICDLHSLLSSSYSTTDLNNNNNENKNNNNGKIVNDNKINSENDQNNENEINKKMKIVTKTSELSITNRSSDFPDSLFSEVNEIFSAVDTAKAREEICTLSFTFGINFLESGTRGNECSASSYLPSITSRYIAPKIGDTEFNCIGREFPFRPRHTIGWGKDLFDLFFYRTVSQYRFFIELLSNNNLNNNDNDTNNDNNNKEENDNREKLLLEFDKELIEKEIDEVPIEFRSNVLKFHQLRSGDLQIRKKFCYLLFREFFIKKIENLLERHPPDSLDPSGGNSSFNFFFLIIYSMF